MSRAKIFAFKKSINHMAAILKICSVRKMQAIMKRSELLKQQKLLVDLLKNASSLNLAVKWLDLNEPNVTDVLTLRFSDDKFAFGANGANQEKANKMKHLVTYYFASAKKSIGVAKANPHLKHWVDLSGVIAAQNQPRLRLIAVDRILEVTNTKGITNLAKSLATKFLEVTHELEEVTITYKNMEQTIENCKKSILSNQCKVQKLKSAIEMENKLGTLATYKYFN